MIMNEDTCSNESTIVLLSRTRKQYQKLQQVQDLLKVQKSTKVHVCTVCTYIYVYVVHTYIHM
jgi:hypothetical protein